MAKTLDQAETIVAAGMRIEGEIRSSGNVKIDGIVSGKIQTSKDLEIGEHAQIEADLVAFNATIAGVIKGNVLAKGMVQILPTGKVVGNIACSSLGIAPGAYFSGACKMTEPKEPKIAETQT